MAEFIDENEEEELSIEEIRTIGKHFLMSAPPCQFKEVLADVQKLLPAGALSDGLVSTVARQYNNKHGNVLTTPDGEKFVTCKAAEVDEARCNTGTSVVSVNHFTEATEACDLEAPVIPEELMPKVRELRTALSKYVSSQFLSKDSASGVFVVSENQLTARIVGVRANLRSMWSGRWGSDWSITLTESGTCTIIGSVSIICHYFEDGNVQMNTKKKVPSKTFKFTSGKNFADLLSAHIQTTETELASGLGAMYYTMSAVTFKALRRTLPITRTKMDWNVNAHKVAKSVGK